VKAFWRLHVVCDKTDILAFARVEIVSGRLPRTDHHGQSPGYRDQIHNDNINRTQINDVFHSFRLGLGYTALNTENQARREGGVGGLATSGPATFGGPTVSQKYKVRQNVPF